MKASLGPSLAVDVDRLLVSRLLVQANSGGGKSWALRRLLEQTFGACQHLVLDPEGEFHTLRERFDYVLAGKGGETKASVDTAGLLALRLLELGTSAIIDISELGVDRPAFVTRFLESLMGAPRELWHSVLVVVDEAHRYCPQGVRPRQPSQRDEDEPLTAEDSAAAVISLMDSGRKRGFCGVLATQRISKLSKDASAECNNKLIGRCVELDAKRAGDELGLTSKNAIEQLRKLRAGQFFAFGPALCDDVALTTIGEVQTTHPEAGKAAPPPTPPRDRIRQVLGKLADLPKEAADEKAGTEVMRTRIRELEKTVADLRATNDGLGRHAAQMESQARRDTEAEAELAEIRLQLDEMRAHARTAQERLGDLDSAIASILNVTATPRDRAFVTRTSDRDIKPANGEALMRERIIEAGRRRAMLRHDGTPAKHGTGAGDPSLGGGPRKILTALAQYPGGRSKQQVAILTGYAHGGGGFANYIGALRSKLYIEGDSSSLRITQVGLEALGEYTPLPSGRALFEHWLGQLGKAEREILRVLYDEWPNARPKDYVASKAGYQASGGGFNNALGRLRTLELIEGKTKLKASDTLRDGAR